MRKRVIKPRTAKPRPRSTQSVDSLKAKLALARSERKEALERQTATAEILRHRLPRQAL